MKEQKYVSRTPFRESEEQIADEEQEHSRKHDVMLSGECSPGKNRNSDHKQAIAKKCYCLFCRYIKCTCQIRIVSRNAL